MFLTTSWLVDLVLLLLLVVFILYKYSTKNFDYWKKRGVFYVKPIPVFGNFYEILTFKTTIAEGLRDLYNQTDEPYLGVFVFHKPVLLLRSPDLIENVLIRDFSYFRNRSLACPRHNPMTGSYLVFQKYKDWKKNRHKLAPIFTSGKLKKLSLIAKNVCNDLKEYIDRNIHLTIDAKVLSHKYTTEVISRCFFGINAYCFKKDDSDIQGISRRIFGFSARNAIIQGLYIFNPDLVEFFKLNFIKKQDEDYIIKVLKEVIAVKKASGKNNEKAFDYIDILVEASDQYESEKNETNKAALTEVLANALQFFIAGTETTSALISFTLYELSINTEIQERVRQEITNILKKNNEISYDSVQNMEYLECCLLETMRKYVSLQVIDREATEDYAVPGGNLVIEKGTTVYVPFYAIHNDEKYFPNPKEYNPDRFIGKDVMGKFLNFIPFGAGPRICIGDRFAMMISKLVMATILTSYEVQKTESTPVPMVLETRSFVFQSKYGRGEFEMLITSFWTIDFILFLIFITYLIYKYSTRNFNYWKTRNVYYETPLPLFGNFKDVIVMKTTIGEWLKEAYDRAKDVPYFGTFIFDKPTLVIKDPRLIKNIMIKDFHNFTDRTIACPEHDKVVSNILFVMPNPQWRDVRSRLSPVFTSGKLKGMFPILGKTGERLQKYLYDKQGTIEAKEVMAKFATDVIAECFFGIKAHCFDDENAIFRVLGRAIFDFRFRNAFAQTAYFSMHNLVKLFKINFFDTWVVDYFTNSFEKAFEAREGTKERKNDFIDILRDMKTKDEDFNVAKLHGASMQFFAAGFETTSATISYTLHELCLNKTIQNKLRTEIMTNIEENGGITYEGVNAMKYLDLCIKETLRKYPVLPFLDRSCLNDYKLPDTDLVIERGTSVYIPMFGLHNDPKYFPQPLKYDPERFLNKIYNSDGLVYIPFGDGPRNCLGERFGLMATKLGVIYTLIKFEVEPCEQTPDPVVFEAKSLVLQSKVGLPMKFKYINPTPA
ncbi:uncharacterized protein LOC130450412 [Diorhabda sublineata]|uniref:uncharacterized protein LOC130450412 n=1 Tax=Diorhabda sublineata TaxID=1163346 RepID=UPI0024E15907|nr:uncharacterized protein LOC130450412 [Diorhabda sublineata]